MSGFRLLAIVLFATLALGGCATVTTGTSQQFAVQVVGPQDSHCTLQKPGYGPVALEQGKTISIPRGGAPLTVQCESSGFDTASVTVDAQVHDRARFGLPVGMLVDYLSGARYVYPEQVTVTLKAVTAAFALNRPPQSR